MPRFPKNQADIVALAWLLRTGLKDNLAIFPAPPVIWAGIGIRRTRFVNARGIALAARATAEAAFTAKDEALQELIEAMKADIRYAENTVDFDDDKLKLIGWAGKKAKTSLTPPGQVRMLEAPKHRSREPVGSFSIGNNPQTAANPPHIKSSAASMAIGKISPRRYSLKLR